MIKLARYKHNPILEPNKKHSWEDRAVFNPGVIRIKDLTYMLYRAVGYEGDYMSRFGLATSTDGFTFTREHDTPLIYPEEEYEDGAIEDCRLIEIEGGIYVTYTAVAEPLMKDGVPTKIAPLPINLASGLMKTQDFRSFERIGIISTVNSDDKDTVLFPERINGKFVKFHRPHRWSKSWFVKPEADLFSESVSIPYPLEKLPEKPSVWIAYSDDLINWHNHRPVLDTSAEKIGSGPPPLKTKDGWLLFYHHVEKNIHDTSSVYIYDARVALFDLEDPSRLIARIPYSILTPEIWYEKEGDVNNVVFPTGLTLQDKTLFVYYGAADKYCAVATITLEEVLEELKKYPIV